MAHCLIEGDFQLWESSRDPLVTAFLPPPRPPHSFPPDALPISSMGCAAGFPFVSRPPRRRQAPASSMRQSPCSILHHTGGGNRVQDAGPAPLGSGCSVSLSIGTHCWDPARMQASVLSSHSSETGRQTLTPVMVKKEARPVSQVGARGRRPVFAAGPRPLCSECGPWSCLQ